MLYVLVHKTHGVVVADMKCHTLMRTDVERLERAGWTIQVMKIETVQSVEDVRVFVDQTIYATTTYDPKWQEKIRQ